MADDQATRRDVRDTYEEIADHFSKTREYAWPEVESFVESAGNVDLALDVGCGNGRHAELLATGAAEVLALDASRGLLLESRERLASLGDRVALVQGDAASLPLDDDSVGLAVYVATLHHLPRREDRRRSLDELARVLAPDGRALVSAWSTAHDRFDASADDAVGFDTTIDWTRPGDEVVPRFYHIYAPDEFREDVAASGLALVDFEISSGNCYAVVRPEGKRP
ncbi:Methyltransferase domain-containing protein [Halomicrobium zhouii]|uniref:Methyltransferase domain-containing protein n=1 Tax=Halomicrobium zhouii TaxID=767519 RepID=A0A1I6LSE3_9EURY|nr:class I SAM-dependent methyltransferase [Halomicrobium zhouii]SFS06210.1 Methyltransferase domain-containing protein [Halomicrobium zhouii]